MRQLNYIHSFKGFRVNTDKLDKLDMRAFIEYNLLELSFLSAPSSVKSKDKATGCDVIK